MDATITGTTPATYTLSLVVVDAAGHRATSERDLDTVLVPTPHIEGFQLEDRSPGLGEVTNIAAVESGLSGAEATWNWRVAVGDPDLAVPGAARTGSTAAAPVRQSRARTRSR